MALILKLETADSIAVPTAGRGTLFLNPDNQLLVKTTSGNITSVATLTTTGNTSVMYNNAGEVGLSGNMTFDNTTNTFAVTNANISNLTVTGTLIAGDIAVSSIANGTSNVDIAGVSGNITISVAGNANVLTVTNTGIIVSGTANVGNLGTEKILASDSITTTQQLISNVSSGTAPLVIKSTTQVANLNVATAGLATFATTANAVAGANISGQVANALVAGTVYTNAQPNITSVGTLTSLAVTGNTTTGNLIGVHANGNSNVNIATANGNVTIAAVGNTTLTVTGTGANIFGYANITGNISAGNVNAGNLLTANYSTAVITTAAQPNITSVGTLTSLAVTGNVTMANVVASTYDITGVAPAVSAAGTTQGTGTVLAKAINVVSTVAASSGVVLPVAVAGMRITVMNTSANSLLVYPASSGIINTQAANAAYTQDAGARLDFVSVSATQWYTLNATYG